jgi:hypothetical protein
VVIRIRKSKKERQYNDQKKKVKRTNNDLQNLHKTTYRVTRTPLKIGGELKCSGRVSSSYSNRQPSTSNIKLARLRLATIGYRTNNLCSDCIIHVYRYYIQLPYDHIYYSHRLSLRKQHITSYSKNGWFHTLIK